MANWYATTPDITLNGGETYVYTMSVAPTALQRGPCVVATIVGSATIRAWIAEVPTKTQIKVGIRNDHHGPQTFRVHLHASDIFLGQRD